MYADDDPLNLLDPAGLWWGALCVGAEVSAYLGFGAGASVSGCVGWSSGSGLMLTASVSDSVGIGGDGDIGVFAAAEGGSEDYASQISGTSCTAGTGISADVGIAASVSGACGGSPHFVRTRFEWRRRSWLGSEYGAV